MSDITYRGVVYPRQCDHMGHMNVASYVEKFDEATWQVFRMCGITRRYMEEEKVAMAGVRQEIDYKRELRPGDTIRIESSIIEVGDRKLTWLHQMFDDSDDALVAVCKLTAVHIGADNRKATPFPPHIKETASSLIPT